MELVPIFINRTSDRPIHSDPRQIVSYELFEDIQFYLRRAVSPIIAIVGITGNSISAVVVVRSGLKKPSNILLLGLIVADFCSVIIDGGNVGLWMTFVPGKLGKNDVVWEIPLTPAMICYHLYFLAATIGSYGVRVSAAMTVIITIERLIAIFFPLKFPLIVTAKRAWLVTIAVYLFWVPPAVISYLSFRFVYYYFVQLRLWFGTWKNSDFIYLDTFNVEQFLTVAMIHLSQSLPLALVTLGCIVITVRVSLILKRRKKLQSDKKGATFSLRTTKTLFFVCVVYCITRGTFAFNYLPQMDRLSPVWSNLHYVYSDLINTMTAVNSASNFFIYVAFNTKFRTILKDMFKRR